MSDKERVFIFDTTMRDGEQSPGASMSVEEKIQIYDSFLNLGSKYMILDLKTLFELIFLGLKIADLLQYEIRRKAEPVVGLV